MEQIIAAEIPLIGQLTKEQQKEREEITQLAIKTKEYEGILQNLGMTYKGTGNLFAEGFLNAADVAANTAEKTVEFGKRMYEGLEDGLEKMIRTGQFNFKNFMREMALEFAIMQAKSAMSGMFSTLGSVLGFGGSTGGGGGGRASGGPVVPNRAYTVGEFGRETFVPATAGRIIPNGAMGGSVVINQSFDFSNADNTTEARLRAQAAQISEITKQSVYQDMADGGRVSKLTGRR